MKVRVVSLVVAVLGPERILVLPARLQRELDIKMHLLVIQLALEKGRLAFLAVGRELIPMLHVPLNLF